MQASILLLTILKQARALSTVVLQLRVHELAKLHLKVLISLQDYISGFLYEPSLLKGAYLIWGCIIPAHACHYY
jgi:hypothetical protein